MGGLIGLIMYALWSLTIIAILASTFTGFEYLDLNVIAVALFLFALLNTYFTMAQMKKVKRIENETRKRI